MLPMSPMLIPEVVGVYAGDDKGRDCDAVVGPRLACACVLPSCLNIRFPILQVKTRSLQYSSSSVAFLLFAQLRIQLGCPY